LSPRDGQTIDPAAFNLVWSSDNKSDSGGWKNYLVQLSSNATFSGDALIMQAWAQDTSYPCLMIPHHGTYYWRVGESFNALDDDVRWSDAVEFTYRDTTRDIDFLDPKAGQYSEWKSPGIGGIQTSFLRMWIAGNHGDTADIAGLDNNSPITAQLVRTDSGIFFHSYSEFISYPEFYLRNANDLSQGLATRNRARHVHWSPDVIDTPQPESYAEFDSDFVFDGIHFGEADLLVTTTTSFAESPDYFLAMDKQGHLMAFGEFGDAPRYTFILLPKPARVK